MEQHKTKVVAIRVTEQEYKGLQLAAKELNWSVSKLIHFWLEGQFVAINHMALKQQKKEDARLKRLAKKEAASGL